MKAILLTSISAIVISTLAAVGARSVLGEQTKIGDDQSGSGWEYLVVQGGTVNLSPSGGSMRKEDGPFSREAFPLEKNMDKLGAKGWELVAIAGSSADPVFYFKRRK